MCDVSIRTGRRKSFDLEPSLLCTWLLSVGSYTNLGSMWPMPMIGMGHGQEHQPTKIN